MKQLIVIIKMATAFVKNGLLAHTTTGIVLLKI